MFIWINSRDASDVVLGLICQIFDSLLIKILISICQYAILHSVDLWPNSETQKHFQTWHPPVRVLPHIKEYYEHGCHNVLNFAIRRFFSGYGLLIKWAFIVNLYLATIALNWLMNFENSTTAQAAVSLAVYAIPIETTLSDTLQYFLQTLHWDLGLFRCPHAGLSGLPGKCLLMS